jgi:hypothetical protein
VIHPIFVVVGETAVRWEVGLEGRLEVVWLDQLAAFNEDKKVRLFWELDKDVRYSVVLIILHLTYSTYENSPNLGYFVCMVF